MVQPFFADSIYIIAQTTAAAEQLKAMIAVRGFDRMKCFTFDDVNAAISQEVPDLVLIDSEGARERAIDLVGSFAEPVSVIYLAEAFQEEEFLNCFDKGATDFLIKPVPPSYLASRVILALDDGRLRQQLVQRDGVLRELGVIGPDSRVFTTQYLVKLLKDNVEMLTLDSPVPLSLLIMQIEGFNTSLAVNVHFKKILYAQVAERLLGCCRGSDVIGEYFEDKFALVLPNTGLNGATVVARRILQRLSGFVIPFENQNVQLTVHIGAADFSGCIHYEDLINKALEGLKQARNRYYAQEVAR